MKKNIVTIVAVLIIGLLVACSADNGDSQDEAEAIIPVETAQAKEDAFVVDKTLNGRTMPNRTTPVLIEMPGEVDTLHVENGDHVEEDDVLATLKTSAGDADIKAPRAGEVAELEVEEGDMTTDSDPLAVILDLENLKVDYTVTSNMRSLLEKDMELDSVVDGNAYDTTIQSIASLPGETGLYPVQGLIDNEDGDLIPGLMVKTSVPEERMDEALIVPTEAIIEESEGAFIYIVTDEKAVKTDITIKASQSDETAIEGEVTTGDEIVINGQLTLSDGVKVEIVTEEENQS